MSTVHTSALASIIRGVGASAVGTVAMDVFLYRRYRRGGGDAAFPALGVLRRPRELGQRAGTGQRSPASPREGAQHEVPPRYARTLNNVTHWGFGMGAPSGMVSCRIGSHVEAVVRTSVRRGCLGHRVRRAPVARRLQSDLGIRPRDAQQGPERAPRLRHGHRGGVPGARRAGEAEHDDGRFGRWDERRRGGGAVRLREDRRSAHEPAGARAGARSRLADPACRGRRGESGCWCSAAPTPTTSSPMWT